MGSMIDTKVHSAAPRKAQTESKAGKTIAMERRRRTIEKRIRARIMFVIVLDLR